MIFNAIEFEERVCRQFRDSWNCCFESGYKLTRCLQDYAEFKAGEFYLLWMGHYKNVVILRRFIYLSKSDEIRSIEEGIFQDLDQSQDVFGMYCPGEGHFRCFINSCGKQVIVPYWHFDWREVKARSPFNTRGMSGKWEKCCYGDDEVFMGWSFYYGKALMFVFNIENGTWLKPEQLTENKKIRFADGYKVGNVKLSMHALRIDKAPRREYLNY